MKGELPADFAARRRRSSSPRNAQKAETSPRARPRSRRSRRSRRCCRSCSAARPTSPARTSRTGQAVDGGDARRRRGNYIYYGVREFGMAAIMNGLALHGGFIPYGGTFLTFSDYARNALRMAALMKLARDLRVHARLDRPGRGRPDAPADRARGEPAPDPEHGRLASVRHGRDGGRLGARARAQRRPDGAAVLAPEPARSRSATPAASPTSRAAATCSPIRRRPRCAARRHHRDRLRSAARARRARSARAGRRRGARRVDAVHAAFDRQDAAYRARVLPHGVPARRGRSRASPTSGASTSAPSTIPPRVCRHRPLRRVGAGSRAVQALRLHRRTCRASGARLGGDESGPMTIGIRRATVDDAAAIARVRIDCWRLTYRGLIPDAYLDGMQIDDSTALWQRVLSAGQNTTSVFVAENDGDVVGFAAGNMLLEPRYDVDAELSAVVRAARVPARAASGAAWSRRLPTRSASTAPRGLIVWVIAGNKGARGILRRARCDVARRAAVRMGRNAAGGSRLRVHRPRRAAGGDARVPGAAGRSFTDRTSNRASPVRQHRPVHPIPFSTHWETRDDDQSRDQRLRPHRPQRPARALRGRQEARHRRSSRSTISAARDQRAPDALRHRARQVPGHGRGRRRFDGRQRRPHQGVRAARSGGAAVGRARRRRRARVHRAFHHARRRRRRT